MDSSLETYLLGDHRLEKSDLEELQHLVHEVLDTFQEAFIEAAGTWPYQLESRRSPAHPRRVSMSTTAMIAFSLGLATGRVRESSLAPSVADPVVSDKRVRSRLEALINRSLDAVVHVSHGLTAEVPQRMKDLALPRPDPPTPLTESATFGWDDPFTLTWLLEVLHGDRDPVRAAFAAQLRRRAGALDE